MPSTCPSNTASQILVDDTDSRIDYSLEWKLEGIPGKECNNTTHSSNNIPGATANFSFEGTGIQVYGTVPPDEFTPSASFQVDELSSIPFTFNGDGVVHYQMMFYATNSLSFGNHTLIMTVTSNSSTGLYLDYLLYNPILTITAPTSDATSMTVPSTSIAAIESAVPSASISTIGFQSHCPVDTLAGWVVGATMIGVTLDVFLMCLLFHKSRRIQDLFRVQAKPRPGDGDQLIIDRYLTNASPRINATPLNTVTDSNAEVTISSFSPDPSFDSSPKSPTTITTLSYDSTI